MLVRAVLSLLVTGRWRTGDGWGEKVRGMRETPKVKSISLHRYYSLFSQPVWKILMKPAEEFKTIGRDLPSVAPLLHCDIFHIPTAWDKRTSWSLEDGGPMMAGVR